MEDARMSAPDCFIRIPRNRTLQEVVDMLAANDLELAPSSTGGLRVVSRTVLAEERTRRAAR